MNSYRFDQLGLSSTLLSAVDAAGYQEPTEVQARAIPALLEGADVLATAQTGTGKTAAFLLPLIDRLSRHGRQTPQQGSRGGRARVARPAALILAPTRELAVQIDAAMETYGRGSGVSHTVVFGGVGKGGQADALARSPRVLIATPGRLLDFIGEARIDLGDVEHLVLDEADRMLDMGFIPDVRRIAGRTRSDRQTALFSATMPTEVLELAGQLTHDAVRIGVVATIVTVDKIVQQVLHLDQEHKTGALSRLIHGREMSRVIVFTRTKHKASRLAKQLAKDGLLTDSIHGDKSQNARQRALEQFRSGRVRVLVATDVASRGIDVDDISHVINYDIPHEPESYVHRIGRTARAGAAGSAVSLCSPLELPALRAIERLQKLDIAVFRSHEYHIEPPAPDAPRTGRSTRRRGGSGSFRSGRPAAQGQPRPDRHRVPSSPNRF